MFKKNNQTQEELRITKKEFIEKYLNIIGNPLTKRDKANCTPEQISKLQESLMMSAMALMDRIISEYFGSKEE